jgi:hypothetical protein
MGPVLCCHAPTAYKALNLKLIQWSFLKQKGAFGTRFLFWMFAFPFNINYANLLEWCRWTADKSAFITHTVTTCPLTHNIGLSSCCTFQHWWVWDYVLFCLMSGDCFFLCWGTGWNGFFVKCNWMQRKAWSVSLIVQYYMKCSQDMSRLPDRWHGIYE